MESLLPVLCALAGCTEFHLMKIRPTSGQLYQLKEFENVTAPNIDKLEKAYSGTPVIVLKLNTPIVHTVPFATPNPSSSSKKRKVTELTGHQLEEYKVKLEDLRHQYNFRKKERDPSECIFANVLFFFKSHYVCVLGQTRITSREDHYIRVE